MTNSASLASSRRLCGVLAVAACAALTLTLAACDAADPGAAGDPSTLAFDGATSNGQARLPVCHRMSSDSNEYIPIEVAEPAYLNHLDHGDSAIGEPIPDPGPHMIGYVFDDACEPAPPELPACLADAIARINSEIPDHPLPTDPASVSPWTLINESITEVTYVDDKGTSFEGDDAGYKLQVFTQDGSARCEAATLRGGTWGHTDTGSYGYSLQLVSNYFDYLASL